LLFDKLFARFGGIEIQAFKERPIVLLVPIFLGDGSYLFV
jgi:hypothetical protein